MRSDFSARIALQRKIAWLLLFSFFSLCFIGWLIYFNKKTVANTTFWINHSHAVIDYIEKSATRIDTWDSLGHPPLDASFRLALKADVIKIDSLTKDNAIQQDLTHRLLATVDSLGMGASGGDIGVPGGGIGVPSRGVGVPGPGNRDSASIRSTRTLISALMQQELELLIQRSEASKAADTKSSWLLISGSGLVFLFITVILFRLNDDIVLRRQAEQKSKEYQTWLQSILDNTTSLIYIKDLSGRYVIANRQFQEVMNVSEEKVIGHTDADFSTPEAAAHYRMLDEQIMQTGKSLEIEEVIPGPGGDLFLLSMKFPLRDANGALIGIGGIATDITERIHYQHTLIAATREAQSAKSMQEMFLANMSHEIRTPMNGIQGMADLLLDTPLTDQQKEFARIIKRSVNNLLVVVNDVLDFSKIKAGKLAIEKIEFRLTDVMENVRAMFAHRMSKKGLKLDIDLDADIPETLKGDPYRLNQVLINLIGNAIKFTDKGGIRVQVTAQERTARQVNLLFSVADSGIGIPEKSLPFIFDHFSQAGLDISRRYGGTGLGLAICAQLLQLQGGEISVDSKENQGTTFQFRLTYGYTAMPEKITPAILSDHLQNQVLSGRRILVAEDNEVNQQLIDHVLRKAGSEVTLAGNGEEAVNYLRQGKTFDLVIMDLQMPIMDGYAATRCIRQELQLSVPIVAMTATALVDEQLHCLEVGMNDYMTKPFEFAELYKRISTLIYH